MAVITQAKVIRKILKHLGLPTEVVLKETQPVWRVRGPPEQLFPEDVDETGKGAGAEYLEAQTRKGLGDRGSGRRERGTVRCCAAELWPCGALGLKFGVKLALTRGWRGRRVAARGRKLRFGRV